MDSVRGLYCIFIRMTSVPAFCKVSTPASSAARKSSRSTLRMASTVPVCHITRLGFGSTNKSFMLRRMISAVWPVLVRVATRVTTLDSLWLRATSSLAGYARLGPSAPPMVEDPVPYTAIASWCCLPTALVTRFKLLSTNNKLSGTAQDGGSTASACPAMADAASSMAMNVLMPVLMPPLQQDPHLQLSGAAREFVLPDPCTTLSTPQSRSLQ